MADSKFLANRLKYHTASRVAYKPKDPLAGAFNVDGHTVTMQKVWAATKDQFAYQSNPSVTEPTLATNDLVAVFKSGGIPSGFYKDETGAKGYVWTNPKYPAVKLYEKVPFVPISDSQGPASDGGGKVVYQAYGVFAAADGISSGTIRISDWIAPPAVIDESTGNPVAGYSGIQYNKDNKPLYESIADWSLEGGHWEFVYMAGLLLFEHGFTPEEKQTVTTGLTLTAFKYDGDYLSDINTDIQEDITEISGTTIPAIESNITTISGTTIPAIQQELAKLDTAISNSREMFQATAYISGDVIYADGAISSTISATILQKADFANDPVLSGLPNGVVIISGFPAEVLSVKEIRGTQSEEIYPDIDYTAKAEGISESTTLSAEYATSGEVITSGIQWQLTFRM